MASDSATSPVDAANFAMLTAANNVSLYGSNAATTVVNSIPQQQQQQQQPDASKAQTAVATVPNTTMVGATPAAVGLMHAATNNSSGNPVVGPSGEMFNLNWIANFTAYQQVMQQQQQQQQQALFQQQVQQQQHQQPPQIPEATSAIDATQAAATRPTYVNAKQYRRILKRRDARRVLEEYYQRRRAAIAEKKPYMHESRHRHAMKRPRGPGGRFLTKDELVEYYQKHPEQDPANLPPMDEASSSDPSPLKKPRSTPNVNHPQAIEPMMSSN